MASSEEWDWKREVESFLGRGNRERPSGEQPFEFDAEKVREFAAMTAMMTAIVGGFYGQLLEAGIPDDLSKHMASLLLMRLLSPQSVGESDDDDGKED